MATPALHQIASLKALRLAWLHIHQRTHGTSRYTCGVDGESVHQVASNLEYNLSSIRRHLLSSSGYIFSPLRASFIPKSDGQERVICIPTVRDRIVQRAISNYLASGDKCKLSNNVSYGFLKDRGVRKAIQRACNLRKNKPWVYKTDITSFFDRISRNSLKEHIRKKVRSSTLHPLLYRALEVEIHEPSRERQRRLHLLDIHEGKGVRQGMPLSPFFANLVLRDFDGAIEKKNIKMVRYADDLAIFEVHEHSCKEVHWICKELLATEGLDIPDPSLNSKTQIFTPKRPADFLGVAIKKSGANNYRPFVVDNQLQKLSARILSISSITEARSHGFTLPRLLQRIEHMIGGFEQAYRHCANHSNVTSTCANARCETTRRLFAEIGVNVEELTDEQRAFLGIS